jgi:hypothetical protein
MGKWYLFPGGIMDGTELRRRLDRLDRPYTELAPLLGLTSAGLHKQMRGERRVTRQTEIVLEQLERGCIAVPERSASTGRELR